MSKNDLYPLSDRILRMPQVEEATGIKHSYIYVLMRKGQFPQNFLIGEKAVGWSSREIDEWITERKKRTKK